MRALVLRNAELVVKTLPDLQPEPGQVLVEPIACGICGSDLHAVHHAPELVAAAESAGNPGFLHGLDPSRDFVMGHEFSCRVLAVGKGVTGIEEGREYASMPFLETDAQRVVLGYSNEFPGGFSEQVLVSPASLLPIPNGLDPGVAALTEPMAVGLQAVNASAIDRGGAALVTGAGPVGLAIIASLASSGVETIIASDFSAERRRLAEHMGAAVVVDPEQATLVDAWREHADALEPPVLFDAVGVPGMIDSLMEVAPERSQIVVAGVCMPPDTIRPFLGLYKRLNLQFVLGWTPEEFATSLHNLAEGRIDGSSLLTGEVGLDDAAQAFDDLANPDQHVKVVVRPDL